MPVLMSIDGISGPGAIPEYEGWLLLSTFEWSGLRGLSGKEGAGKSLRTRVASVTPQLSAVKIGRTSDFISAQIWSLMLTSQTRDVKFVWLRTGTDRLIPYLKLDLGGAQIVSMGEHSSFAEPEEAISFTYQTITLTLVNVGDALSGPQDVVRYSLPQASRS